MKTWKTVFIVFGIVIVLSVISGMAYLSPIEVEDKCKPKKNAPDMQSDGVGWIERSETQQSNLSLNRWNVSDGFASLNPSYTSEIGDLSSTSIGIRNWTRKNSPKKHGNSRCLL